MAPMIRRDGKRLKSPPKTLENKKKRVVELDNKPTHSNQADSSDEMSSRDHSSTLLEQDSSAIDIDGNSFYHAGPSKEFSSKITMDLTYSPNGRKRSLRNISVENSPSIPLNDDCIELEKDEEEKTLNDQEKPPADSSAAVIDDEPEMSIVRTMTLEQMQEHVSRCLQLSTENKINMKNAFALKLIDCMSIISKNLEGNNFAAMACQLDAGAKIYSHRVDAVHQQVLKLVETCMFAEKREKKSKTGTETQNDKNSDVEMEGEETTGDKGKGKRKKSKKVLVSTVEQINRKPKENDPRAKFVRLEALPGDILDKAKRDPSDLSLTLDAHIPFWPDWFKLPPITVPGKCEIVPIGIKNRKLGPALEMDFSSPLTPPKLLFIPPASLQDDDCDMCDDEAGVTDFDEVNDINEDVSKESRTDDPTEVELVSLARSRMASDGSSAPSRLDVIKALFHRPGESEYHYLKMDNSYYWAGPSYWKRPTGVNTAANKKKVVRKKKEPLTLEFTDELANKSLKPKKNVAGFTSRRSTILSKRTLAKWTMKKVTYPQDIHFKPQFIQMLYLVETVTDGVFDDMTLNLPNDAPPEDIEMTENNDEVNDLEEGVENLDVNDDGPDSEGESEEKPVEEPKDVESEEKKTELDPNLGFGSPSASQAREDLAVPSTSSAGAGSSGSFASCDVYEGDNLVPKPKMVKVDPIRCVAKPNRVDMQHLKEVMLAIILRGIEDRENQLRTEGVNSPRGSIYFRTVLSQLFNTDELHHRTREDLTVQMSFLALLTLANENSFSLKKDETEDVVISFYQPEVPAHISDSDDDE